MNTTVPSLIWRAELPLLGAPSVHPCIRPGVCLCICAFPGVSGVTGVEAQSMRFISGVINVVRFSCHA